MNVKRGKRGSASQGFCIGRSPYGYLRRIEVNGVPGRIVPRGEHKPPSTAVRYWPEGGREQENVVRLFTLYAQGRHSLHDLARDMQTRDSSVKWSHNRVRDIIRSSVYIGTYVARPSLASVSTPLLRVPAPLLQPRLPTLQKTLRHVSISCTGT